MAAGKQLYNWVMSKAGIIIAAPLVSMAAARLHELWQTGELAAFVEDILNIRLSATFNEGLRCEGCTPAIYGLFASLALLVVLYLWHLMTRPRPVYVVDFCVQKMPDSWEHRKETFIPLSRATGKFTESELDFQHKILHRSGLGNQTYVPPWLTNPAGPIFNMEHARMEFEQTSITAVKELLSRTGVNKKQIKCVIVNSSLFNPTPSLSATIINHFKLPADCINYNLGGMGCSAGLISIDLARKVLQLQPNTYVLVLSHENLTNNWYPGSQKSMLIPNCIFRSNGAAILLSNKASEAGRAKYALRHMVRTNLAADDRAFNCVYEQEDEMGNRGVKLSKELMCVAGQALKKNMTSLGPLVLPLSEKLLFAAHMLRCLLLGKKGSKPYVPDFNLAFDHICIHTGGRAVIDTMEQQLSLTRELIEPSRATLYRFGNVSSTSIWYVLGFIESYKGVKKGDRVWQLSFGSGFKCNSAVWVANRKIEFMHPAWQGFDVEHMWKDLAAMDEAEGLTCAKKKH